MFICAVCIRADSQNIFLLTIVHDDNCRSRSGSLLIALRLAIMVILLFVYAQKAWRQTAFCMLK